MKAKSTKWQWIVIIVLGIALLVTIGLSMSAAWFHDSDGADTDTELGHAVTVRLQDVESGEDGVKGWKELYDSKKTQAYPGDTLVAATRIELKSTTPTLIRAKITATVKDADDIAVTLSADKPTDMGENETDDEYYEALIASKKTDEDYETKSIEWNIYLLGNMMKSLELDETKWTEVGDWMYYTSIYGDTTSPSQSTSGTIDLFDKLVLNPLLTNEAANWKISLNLTVEAIQAANMESSTHPWYDDIQNIAFGEYDRANVEPTSAEYFTFNSTTGTITGLQGDGLSQANIVIPSDIESVAVTAIGDNAFYGNTTLKTVKFATSSLSASCQTGSQTAARMKTRASSSGVQTIGSSAFSGCTNLTSINLPKTLTSIGNSAFYGCSGLTSITIPEGVTSIGSSAFSGCSGLASITIPSSVTSIEGYAFYNCSGLTSITIPSSVTNIGSSAFYGCGNLTYNTCNNAKYLGNSTNSYLVLIKASSTRITSCEISENCRFIYDSAFFDCSGLTSITIPSSVTNIGSSAFRYCSGLTSITIPSSVTSIEKGAFNGCSSLETVKFAEGSQLTSIGMQAFYSCSSLTSFTIPEGVTSIGDRVFDGCGQLSAIAIPITVKTIGVGAFSGCANLKGVYYPGTKDDFNKIDIGEDNKRLTDANIYFESTKTPD